MEYVKLLDKVFPYELLEDYILTLWDYKHDWERQKAHDKIFNYIGVIRRGPGSIDDEGNDVSEPYFDKLDRIVSEAFVCCGQTVMRNNVCRGECGEELTIPKSIQHLRKYLKLKKLLIVK
jgi:hypothetical protein